MAGMSEVSIDELFTQTLKGESDDEAAWTAIHALRRLGTREVFLRAEEWCSSDDPKVRERGVDILAQIGSTAESPGNKFAEESFEIVSKLISQEADLHILYSELVALGHIGIEAGVPIIVPFASHQDSDIRWAVAFALCSFANDSRCILPLLKLMEDSDVEIRDWATFALASQDDTDSDQIRSAFIRCLDDSSEDVREEALVGLARRRDSRALPTLICALERGDNKCRIVEAASWMLGMDSEPEDWDSTDYLAALRKRFEN